METVSALLAICEGNSLVTGEFPAQRPVTRSFDVFFDRKGEVWGVVRECKVWLDFNIHCVRYRAVYDDISRVSINLLKVRNVGETLIMADYSSAAVQLKRVHYALSVTSHFSNW